MVPGKKKRKERKLNPNEKRMEFNRVGAAGES